MKIAHITGIRTAGLREVRDLEPKNDIVVVKVHSAPMCTEYHRFEKGESYRTEFGHEASGEVVAVDKANFVKVGDRVVVQPQTACGKCDRCREGDFIHCGHNRDYYAESENDIPTGTMAQFVLKSEHLLTPVPDGMTYDHASMACCGLGPTFNAMKRLKVSSFDTVLISGLGPVGLGGVVNATYRGAKVIGIDANPYRLKLAEELGAFATIDISEGNVSERVKELTNGIGADKSVETSGTPESKPVLLDSMRTKGVVALTGWKGDLDASTIIRKGLAVYGAWHYNLHDAGQLIHQIGEVPEQLNRFITHTFPMSRIQEAWELLCSGQSGKVILHPWD